MADDADISQERELKRDQMTHSFRYDIPKGVAGECRECEEHSPRLINKLCARCRDMLCR